MQNLFKSLDLLTALAFGIAEAIYRLRSDVVYRVPSCGALNNLGTVQVHDMTSSSINPYTVPYSGHEQDTEANPLVPKDRIR